MESFFSDWEVRRFSFKEKISCIFEQLYTILQPVETISHKTIYLMYPGSKKRRIKIITCIFNEKNVSLINKIKLPFYDISVNKKDSLEYIEITGEDFCYRFPPIMMPQIWYRLKKAL